MGLHGTMERLGHASALDRVGEPLRRVMWRVLPRGRVREALHGTWLGHPLHPVLTDMPIGMWTSAVVLDALDSPGTDHAADTLVALGTVASLPTVAAGLADWSRIEDPETRRMGVAHALANATALALFTASMLARPGNRATGRRLATLGSGALALGGYVGAHLTYVHGVGVSARARAEEAQAVPEGEQREPERAREEAMRAGAPEPEPTHASREPDPRRGPHEADRGAGS